MRHKKFPIPETVPVTVRIPVEVSARLEEIAVATARGKSWLAAVAEGYEDAGAGRLAEHDKVRRWLRSWGSGKELPSPKSARGGARTNRRANAHLPA